MSAKVIKVLIIKNDLNSVEKEIYCVKLSLNDDLAGLKEKLYARFVQNTFLLFFDLFIPFNFTQMLFIERFGIPNLLDW